MNEPGDLSFLDAVQSRVDDILDTCTKCGKGPVERLMSSPAIQFKGSGWYITDYAKKSSTDNSGGTKKDSSSDTKSESTSGTASTTSESSTTTTTKDSSTPTKSS